MSPLIKKRAGIFRWGSSENAWARPKFIYVQALIIHSTDIHWELATFKLLFQVQQESLKIKWCQRTWIFSTRKRWRCPEGTAIGIKCTGCTDTLEVEVNRYKWLDEGGYCWLKRRCSLESFSRSGLSNWVDSDAKQRWRGGRGGQVVSSSLTTRRLKSLTGESALGE